MQEKRGCGLGIRLGRWDGIPSGEQREGRRHLEEWQVQSGGALAGECGLQDGASRGGVTVGRH